MKKIRNKLIMAVTMGLMAASCQERPEMFDHSLKVGNVLLSDNTIISPDEYDKSSEMAVGVIFYYNADTVLVVSTKELGQYMYADSLGTISNVTNDTYTKCGTENTAAMMNSEFNCPAVNAIVKYPSPISSWALPSAGELNTLARNLTTVKKAMIKIGGDDFTTGQYVSSSQDGSSTDSEEMYYYSVSLTNGFVVSTLKTTPKNVRAILKLI